MSNCNRDCTSRTSWEKMYEIREKGWIKLSKLDLTFDGRLRKSSKSRRTSLSNGYLASQEVTGAYRN